MDRQQVLRAEKAERAALADLAAASSGRADRGAPVVVAERIDGVLVAQVRSGPGSIVVNRAVGLGVERPATRDTVRTIVAAYRLAGVDRYFVHLDPLARPAGVERWMGEEGLEPYHRAWAKFVRGPEPPPTPVTDLTVERIGPERGELFGRLAAEGFGLDSSWAEVIAATVGLPGWGHYLTFHRGEPAGCAALRVEDGVAWFDWAATRPEFRRRGSQAALLARRIADAVEARCDLLVTATGEAVEGDPQHSYRNIERAGFRRSHSRANWTPMAGSGPR